MATSHVSLHQRATCLSKFAIERLQMDSQVKSVEPESQVSIVNPQSKQIVILGEIVGATNLGAALRGHKGTGSFAQPKSDFINAYCDVYWGGTLIHRTQTIKRNNNPIWACDTGSLFKIKLKTDAIGELKIEVYDRDGRNKKALGVVIIPGERILNGSICNEKRMQFEMHKDRADTLKDGKVNLIKNAMWNRFTSLAPSRLNPWAVEHIPPDHDEVDDDDSLYGKTVATFGPSNIDDDYIYGKMGTLALRCRVATGEDLSFLKAVDVYNQGFKYAKRKNRQAVKKILDLDGKILARIVSETSTSYQETLNCQLMNEVLDFRIRGKFVDAGGVSRLRVKPCPDPDRPIIETKFLSEPEMLQKCYEPSRKWVESGSGSLGQVRVEILSCQGLPNKDLGQMFGNKTDPFVCLIHEDCLVQTEVVSDCLNPMWMPWTDRAFVFNRMHSLSSIYIGVFNHRLGPMYHTGCGRVAIDLRKFEPNTSYTLKYELFASRTITNRKTKGSITIRLQMSNDLAATKESIVSMMNPPVIHINVKRRKTLAVARYTCEGKYREEVYNMKVLRSYIDEILEYLEICSFEFHGAVKSLIFWRGQVQFFNLHLPLHSLFAYLSAMYVIERPQLIPAYIFFCAAWCMLILMSRSSKHPSPWLQTKSFSHHLRKLTPLIPSAKSEGVKIVPGEGYTTMKGMEEERKRVREEDKMLQSKIASVRSELQQILAAISQVDLVTNENGGGLNPLRKLLPVQLLDIIYYVRWIKLIICCEESYVSYLVTALLLAISVLLFLLPLTKIIHWTCRIFIWVVLGPWMGLVDMVYKSRNSNDKMQKHVQTVMDKIQERERKRWIDGRILREEALKLKATRILRFGRFAIRVPSVNVTRYRDYPLPESMARPIAKGEEDGETVNVNKYIPGQKYYGVMIPELTKPKILRQMEQEKRENKLAQLKQNFLQNIERNRTNRVNDTIHSQHASDLAFQESFSSQQECSPSKGARSMIEPRESLKFNPQMQEIVEEGFELTLKEESVKTVDGDPALFEVGSEKEVNREACYIDLLRSRRKKTHTVLEQRDQIVKVERSVDGEREVNLLGGEIDQQHPCYSFQCSNEGEEMEIVAIMSDLTDQ